MERGPLDSTIVRPWMVGENRIEFSTSGFALACAMASRSDPAPESFKFRTVNVLGSVRSSRISTRGRQPRRSRRFPGRRVGKGERRGLGWKKGYMRIPTWFQKPFPNIAFPTIGHNRFAHKDAIGEMGGALDGRSSGPAQSGDCGSAFAGTD